MDIQIISVSSKGQIAIPAEFRKELSIKTGSQLAAYSDGTNIILKPIELPSAESLQETLDQAKKYAEEEGLTPSDINRIIKEYRQEKREGKV